MKLLWEDKIPFSEDFSDIYYSPEDGEGESRYVFIEGNDLIQRWGKLPPLLKEKQETNKKSFVICELGFGSGLNFCLASRDFLRYAHPSCRLRYIACEKYPLSAKEMNKALGAFRVLEGGFLDFLTQYSQLCPPFRSPFRIEEMKEKKRSPKNLRALQGPESLGEVETEAFQKEISLEKGRLCLSLYFGDVLAMCKELEKGKEKVDAWFLDGFSPSKNPAMWRPEIFQSMARTSREGSTFATFSAAVKVRRGLEEAAFQTQRIPGFREKRHMLRGSFTLSCS